MDHYTDNTKKVIYQMHKEASLPKYAQEHDLIDTSELPDSAFADSISREYPIHTKADTFLSAVYLNKTAADAKPYVKSALENAIDIWGVREDVDNALSGRQEKTASSAVAIEYKQDDDIIHTAYVSSEKGFNKIASDVITNTTYSLRTRQDVAEQLLHKCSQYIKDTDTQDRLEKCAGWGTSTPEVVYDAIRNRALLMERSNEKLADKLNKCAEHIISTYKDVVPKHVLDKTANFIDLVDRASGMHTNYGTAFRRPEEDMYKYTLNDGRMLKKYAVNMQNNMVIKSSDIRNNMDKLSSVLDNAFGIQAEDEKSMRDVLVGLNSKDAEFVYNRVFKA